MKKQLFVALAILFLITSPAYASQNQKNNENRNSDNRGEIIADEKREDVEERKASPTPKEIQVAGNVSSSPVITISPSVVSFSESGEDESENVNIEAKADDGCDAEVEWKNHGEYVSCLAKQRSGGEKVSDAARSDIGKKSDDDSVISVTPSVSPSLSPTLTPPLTSPETETAFRFSSWNELKKLLEEFFRSLAFGKNRNN